MESCQYQIKHPAAERVCSNQVRKEGGESATHANPRNKGADGNESRRGLSASHSAREGRLVQFYGDTVSGAQLGKLDEKVPRKVFPGHNLLHSGIVTPATGEPSQKKPYPQRHQARKLRHWVTAAVQDNLPDRFRPGKVLQRRRGQPYPELRQKGNDRNGPVRVHQRPPRQRIK